MTAPEESSITPGSGNIFGDLELPEAETRLAKAELARQIAGSIHQRGLNQAAAARILGMDQPKVSALLAGRLAGFSLARLASFLTLVGKDVEIVLREKPDSEPTGRLTVRAA